MKKIIYLVLFQLICFTLHSEGIVGSWEGAINIGGSKLPVVFHFKQTEKGYSATMDSPKQNAKDIPVKSVDFRNDTLIIEVPEIAFKYTGILVDSDNIKGQLIQHGNSFELNMSPYKESKPLRPQEPQPPFPYISEDVKFKNEKENFYLAGTLTLPSLEGQYPAVVMITGSGAQNRDEEIQGHKPFWIIADWLTRNGIAVLRVDDRGFAESEGDLKNATTMDFVADVESAISYLKTRKEIDNDKIGLIGHSEGGTICFILAARNKDVSFIVSLAGSAIKGEELLNMQRQLIFAASGLPQEFIDDYNGKMKKAHELALQYSDKNVLAEKYAEVFGHDINSQQVKLAVEQLSSPWIKFFLEYDPTEDLQKIICPVFALNGSKDLQVPAEVNLEAIKFNIEKNGNKDVSAKEYPGLNHLFQTCTTGLPEEYGEIEETIAPQVLEDMTRWILNVVK